MVVSDHVPTPVLVPVLSSPVPVPVPVPVPSSAPFCWSSTLTSVSINAFTHPVGPTFTVPDSPLETFQQFVTDSFIDNIVLESNRYAQQVMAAEDYTKWEKFTSTEMLAYLGFAVIMGIVHLPEVEDYWKLDPYLHYSPIADRISRNRYREIERYLHFVDNNMLPE